MTKTGKETAAEKKARLAAALRANMHKRKAQARGRRAADDAAPAQPEATRDAAPGKDDA